MSGRIDEPGHTWRLGDHLTATPEDLRILGEQARATRLLALQGPNRIAIANKDVPSGQHREMVRARSAQVELLTHTRAVHPWELRNRDGAKIDHVLGRSLGILQHPRGPRPIRSKVRKGSWDRKLTLLQGMGK
eukprot:7316757-Alexandrium_andersonii.AAC.2